MISYFGCILPDEKVNIWKGTSEAANRFQKRFLVSLQDEIESIHSIVSCDCNTDKIDIEGIGGVLLIRKPKHIFGPIHIIIKYLATVIKVSKRKNTVIQFNPEYYSILTPIITRLWKVESVLILSDFTESVEQKNIIKKLFSHILKGVIKKYSKIIVLSDTILVNGHNNILVYRGSVKRSEYENFLQHGSFERIIILYSGLFDEHTGILLLLEAFKHLDQENVELHFSGWGSLESTINKYAESDKRICNHGFLNRDEYLSVMKKAHILINPRDMNFKQNKNNFPSKILEYLASGKIVISTKFSGHLEFDNFEIQYFNSNSKELSSNIKKVILNIKELSRKSYKTNRLYVKRYYIENQIEKIKKFVN